MDYRMDRQAYFGIGDLVHPMKQCTNSGNTIALERFQRCPWNAMRCIENASCFRISDLGVRLVRDAYACMIICKVALFGRNSGYGELLW